MICNSCAYKRQPWSKDLIAEGYVGCGLLLNKDITEETYLAGVDAEVVGFGWITNGYMATNDQPILLAVRKCHHYWAASLLY